MHGLCVIEPEVALLGLLLEYLSNLHGLSMRFTAASASLVEGVC
jgi:hypothetical protein